jgi:pimeloyl-ACP methyl ester carboxylesterase
MKRLAMTFMLLFAVAANAAVELRVEPADALADAPFAVHIDGVAAGSSVTLVATETDSAGVQWQSRATYSADAGRAIDASELLWSMSPANLRNAADYWSSVRAPTRAASRPAPKVPLGPREGELLMLGTDGAQLASAPWTRRRIAQDVERTEVAAGRLRGVWFSPGNSTPRQSLAVVVLGGSFGGLKLDYPALLASRGYPSLALAFFKYADLTDSGDEIPLEYFAEALQWARQQPGIERVVLLGHSRGAEATVLTASLFPSLLAGAVALAPSPVVNNGEGRAWGDWLWTEKSMWTHAGAPVAFAPYVPSQTRAVRSYRERSRKHPPGYGTTGEYRFLWLDPASSRFAIPVQQTRAPLLLVAGTADEIWPADFAVQRLAVLAPDAQALLLPGAGHAFGIPGEVTTYASSVWVDQAFAGWVSLGGDPAANARGATATWRALLEFLARVAR